MSGVRKLVSFVESIGVGLALTLAFLASPGLGSGCGTLQGTATVATHLPGLRRGQSSAATGDTADATRLLLEIDVRERLPAVVWDHEASGRFLPRRAPAEPAGQ